MTTTYTYTFDRPERDGLAALRYRPAQPRGLLLWYHGWSSAASTQQLRALAFCHAGWEVLVPEQLYHDGRGAVAYDAPESYPRFWEILLQNIREAPVWLDCAARAGYDNIIAGGHSMGAFSALGIFAHHTAVRAAVAINGSGHWPLSHLFLQAAIGQILPLAPELEAAVAAASPHAKLAACANRPLLLLHGAGDTVIDARADVNFAAALKENGGDVTLTSYDGVGHHTGTNMLDDAVVWLDRYFPRSNTK